jgi:hypothetical protein
VWTEDKLLFDAAIRKFGHWEKALRAAGLQPKPRRKWSKERVITGLQIWHDQSEKDIRCFDAGLAGAHLWTNEGLRKMQGIIPARRASILCVACPILGEPFRVGHV